MIQHIIDAANSVGISAFITNSEERIEVQLNRLTRAEMSPIMLVSWDINTSLEFDENGFLRNPSSNIVALLVSKPEDTTNNEAEKVSQQMGLLFQKFIQKLREILIPYQTQSPYPLTSISYIHVPKHGAGKHSGVLAKWTMRTEIANCTQQ